MHRKVDAVIVFLQPDTCMNEVLNDFPCMWNSPLSEVSQETQTEFSSTHIILSGDEAENHSL
jgi:hypothetical protein